ncbi:FG-GAP-like repeat-containing protein [Rhodobiaceae bacterium]|nr:FG-GAP-like repeat-containing protein [Rhodobiaceae bacterium]
MADYNGTDEDDIIDASELASDINHIYPGKGNDTVTNAKSGQTIISSPGEDTLSGTNYDYALWQAEQAVTINLKEGWAEDGFGTRDNVSGIVTIHGSSFGDTIYGTENFERFFANGGDNFFNGGGGGDKIAYAPSPGRESTNYTITKVDNEVHIVGPDTKDIVTGVRFIEFMEDNKTIDLSYLLNDSGLKATLQGKVYSFYDDTLTPPYTYSGVDYPEALVNYLPQGTYVIDINDDGIDDVVFPMFKAYGTGADTSTKYIALTTSNGSLVFDEAINDTMPITSASRRSESINLVNSEYPAFVTVNHNTEQESNRGNPDSIVPPSELIIVQSISSSIKQSDIIPRLPDSTDKHPFAVDAHAMGVGDINGDGLDDIFVGHWTGELAYALIQGDDGVFVKQEQDLYKEIINWPSETTRQSTNILRDGGLVDVNGDGFHDLIAGFGMGGSPTTIFINDNGLYSIENKIELPASIYGYHNQMSSKILDADFDHDGDIDIAMLQIQLGDDKVSGYYAGNYIQILRNDGAGNYEDITNFIPENATQDAYLSRLQWNEAWQLIDMNDDNHIDVAGGRAVEGSPLIYFNDGNGRFEIGEIATNESNGKVYAYSDFNANGKMEFISYKMNQPEYDFYIYEMEEIIGTGPGYRSSAKDGAPGFNERYYLNENPSAQEAITSGTYDTGLAHYLAEGKDADLKTFAPFTKVHGYSGSDTIILREGDEIAYGYAGDDTIEGGAGNDIIDGGAGLDSAIYKDSSSAYSLTANDDGTVSVFHSSPSEGFTDEGSDTLTNIEKMQFSDQTLSKTSLKYQLSETIDTSENILSAHTEDVLSGTLNFNKGDNIIILDGQGKTYRGLEGDDTYFISQLLPKNGKVSITDTEGSNLVQLPANTYVDKSLFTKNAARLTLEDGREITISGADKFSYNVGGNITKGDKGTDLTFTEFAEVFGVYDILNSSGAQTGEISDLYII